MPFTYEFKLGEGIPEGHELTFESWCDDAWGEFHGASVRIAAANLKGKRGFIWTNGPCMPMTKGNLKSGDKIASGTIVGKAAADGEDIPYRKPYCIFKETA